MRFKTGVLVGAALGYVLGARAGKRRYLQLRRWWRFLRSHPAVAQLADQGAGVITVARRLLEAPPVGTAGPQTRSWAGKGFDEGAGTLSSPTGTLPR